jgi:hypothetical protein
MGTRIYDKPVYQLMKDMVADLNIRPGQIFTKKEVIDWFNNNYPKIKESTITAHLLRLSVNAQSRVHHNVKPGRDDVFFQIDSSHFRLYDPSTDPAPIYEKSIAQQGGIEVDEEKEVTDGDAIASEFAYEKDLQHFLAKNLGIIEPGLKLYEEEDIQGIEYPVGGRFVDILAVDKDDNLVVIELKVSKGYDRVVGQLLRYMGWIKKNLVEPGQSVRGIIIARAISEDLLLACAGLQNVQLFEYGLLIKLREVTENANFNG